MPGKWIAAFGVILAAAGMASIAAAADVSVEDLRPGLVATFRDSDSGEIIRLEPSIALSLQPGEAPHPQLRADGGTYRWEGYLNVLRPETYRFSARLRGRLRVTVAGKEVFQQEVKTVGATLQQGPEVRLEPGAHPLVAEFTRFSGGARVELWWQAPHFRLEPLPYDHVRHLPRSEPAQLAVQNQIERGRFLAEEHSCIACHRPADNDRVGKGLLVRQGPDLSRVGQRAFAGWIYDWLDDPRKVQPAAVMPRVFTDDDAGRVERYAVARYLASLGGPLQRGVAPKESKQIFASIARGRQLFTSTGCIACHEAGMGTEAQAAPKRLFYNLTTGSDDRSYPLGALGNKTTPEKLAAYLGNPLAVNPSGRMPNMLLASADAADLGRFLCQKGETASAVDLPEAPSKERLLATFKRVEPRESELADFQRLSAEKQWLDVGKRVVIERGCNNCHQIAPEGKPFANVLANASLDDLKQTSRHSSGCLAETAAARGKAPDFKLVGPDRTALREFLGKGTSGAGTPAPAHAARLALQRFNCLACHTREGDGGLSPELTEQLRQFDKAENAEAVVPPPLTGAGHKLRTPWVREVLTRAGRARPWMGLRMPQFGPDNVGSLAEGLAALDGTVPDDTVHRVELTAAKIEAGRHIVGKNALGCITCHDIAGVPNFGTRGPDLALTNQRVRYEWYRRWLEQPHRMQPGTRMPQVFPDGKSLLSKVLNGDADAQAEAMWAYLSLGMSLPLPLGLDPPKGLVVTVKDRTELIRTFMPDAGSRAVAIGFPNGVSTVFDAATCRLAYAWSGNFLDVSPVWDGRGGNPAKVLGPRFWTAPSGVPWAINDSQDPPDFAAIAKDPAFGAGLPDGQLFKGQRLLHFDGYTLDGSGLPTFHYRIDAGKDHALMVHERPEPLRSSLASGLARKFTLEVPANLGPWIQVGEADKEPQLLDAQGKEAAIDWKSGPVKLPAAGKFLVLPQKNERVVIVGLPTIPRDAHWYVRQQGNTWQALLQFPAVERNTKVEVGLHSWTLSRLEPALIKELLAQQARP